MSLSAPILHMMCGKIAAGKSTLAARLAQADGTVLLAEDAWLNALYPDLIRSGADYLRYASQLRSAMAPHIVSLLNTGVSVVLDFPANTVAQRAWMRGLIAASGADHRLHLLQVSDETCLARLHERNRRADHPFKVTDAQFREFTRHFAAPMPDEGVTIVTCCA